MPPLVIGCGALAFELVELTRRAGLPAMDLTCLPASLHNRPERIADAVARRIRRARASGYERIFVAYADCGTGGMLDRVLDAEGVARLEGAHCYEVYAGRAAFAALHDAEPGTFYLTDFLARNFDRLVVRGLGLDHHPELLPLYFGNYRLLVYLAQADDPSLTALAAAAAATLGLAFERRQTGLGELAPALAAFVRPASADRAPDRARVGEAGREPDGPSSDERSGRRPTIAAPGDVGIVHPMTDGDVPGAVAPRRTADSVVRGRILPPGTPGRVGNARSMKGSAGIRRPKDDRDTSPAAAAFGHLRSGVVDEARA